MEERRKRILAYTNPLGWPIVIGMSLAALLNGVFGNVAKRTVKSFKIVYTKEDEY